MIVVNFENPDALKEYAVAQALVAADIVAIIEKDGRWYLFHF